MGRSVLEEPFAPHHDVAPAKFQFSYSDWMWLRGQANLSSDFDMAGILEPFWNFTEEDFTMWNDSRNDPILDGIGLHWPPKIVDMLHAKNNVFEFVTEGVLLISISIFGLIGNMVAIVVLSRPAMKGSFSTLLIGKIVYPR
jgi:hypothetical protein